MRIHLLAWLAISCLPCVVLISGMSTTRRTELREEAASMFRHGYDGYMKHAYPADELKPLSCGPLFRDPNGANFGVNDIHGNVSMTLLDVLSSLPIIYPEAFPHALEEIATKLSFDQDAKIQVFEFTIRALGSLLSTYQHLERLPDDKRLQAASANIKGEVDLKQHMGRLLELALDLGKRLLPAFNTATGIPYARVNLRRGVEKGESPDTCTAGAGSLILEFTVLSRLTGEERFERLATRAYLAIWNRRSPHNLLGNTIGAVHGHWLVPGLSGVGAGMDSFFEYAIKGAILLGNDSYLDIFHDSYAAIQTHIRTADGFLYRPAQFRSLQIGNPSTIDSLSAFLPGMQVLAGDIESAIKSHLVFWNLWRRYSAMPESWAWETRQVVWTGWPGRPEFIESTYYLYKATKDHFYLRVGERMMADMKRRTMTQCGFATLKDVETGDQEDRMESFVLSETLKYLWLLFDDTPAGPASNRVFTTEGHLLSLPDTAHVSRSDKARKGESQTCPVYRPPTVGGGLTVGIERRADYEYARSLVFGFGVNSRAEEDGLVHWNEAGYCSVPIVPRFSVDIVLQPLDAPTATEEILEDMTPSTAKVRQDESTGNWVISDTIGLRLSVRWRLDNRGYDVATIGPHRVVPGQHVIVTDSRMEGYLPVIPPSSKTVSHRLSEVVLRFSAGNETSKSVFLHALGATATFGRDFGASDGQRGGLGGAPILLVRPPKHNSAGCRPVGQTSNTTPVPDGDFYLILERGHCTFAEKLLHAHQAGAAGVLVVDNESPETAGAAQKVLGGGVPLVRPSADGEEEKWLNDLENTGMIFTQQTIGKALGRATAEGLSVYMEVKEIDGQLVDADTGHARPEGRSITDGRAREGRLALGEWEIWNLRIVEAGP